MNKDETLAIAQECGLVGMRPHLDGIYVEAILHFAELLQRPWIGLTDDDIEDAGMLTVEEERMLPYSFAREIEAKLKEKNHG